MGTEQYKPTTWKEVSERAQEAFLQIVETSLFNGMNGPKIAYDMRRHRDLWLAAMTSDGDWYNYLRNMANGMSPCFDVLLIMVKRERIDEFMELAATWEPDEAGWVMGDNCQTLEKHGDIQDKFWERLGNGSPEDSVLVRLWWD